MTNMRFTRSAILYFLIICAVATAAVIPVTTGTVSAIDSGGEKAIVLPKSGNSLLVFDLDTLKMERTVDLAGHATFIGLTPDNKELYLAFENSDKVQIYDAKKLEKIGEFRVSGNSGPMVFSPDGRRVYLSVSNDVQVLDRQTHAVLKTIPTPQSKYGIDLLVSKDGSSLYISRYTMVFKINTADYTMSAIDFSGVKSYWEPGTAYLTRMALSPDDKCLYVSFWDSRNGAVAKASTETGIIESYFSVPKYRCDGIVYCEKPHGNYIYASDWDNGVVYALNASTGNLVATIPEAKGPKFLTLDDGNNFLLAANEFAQAGIISTDSNTFLGNLNVYAIAETSSIVVVRPGQSILDIFMDNMPLTLAATALVISVIALLVAVLGILLLRSRKKSK